MPDYKYFAPDGAEDRPYPALNGLGKRAQGSFILKYPEIARIFCFLAHFTSFFTPTYLFLLRFDSAAVLTTDGH